MKKIILLVSIAGFIFTSCKKERTCTCVYTVLSESSTEPNYIFVVPAPTTSTVKYAKIKSSNIYAQLCKTEDVTYTYNDQYVSGGNVINSVVTRTTHNECELK